MRGLGLESSDEWRDYCKSGKKPGDIPNAPGVVYADAGWAGWGDWLGTGNIAHFLRKYRSADEIRGDLTNIHVRRAEEWIDAHVKDTIGVEDVASAIGVEAEALVRAFKRVRGCSPTRALRRRRLERAREALAAAGPENNRDDRCHRTSPWRHFASSQKSLRKGLRDVEAFR